MLIAKKIDLLSLFASHKKLKEEASELFVYREEFRSIEVNHMGRVRLYPELRFLCNIIDMPFEFPEIMKGANIKTTLSLLHPLFSLYFKLHSQIP
jgi:hypothetical protein